MKCGYVLKVRWNGEQNILHRLKQNFKKIVLLDQDNALVFKDGTVYWVHNSCGESLFSTTKIKVFAWQPFAEPFKNTEEKIQWEVELGKKFAEVIE